MGCFWSKRKTQRLGETQRFNSSKSNQDESFACNLFIDIVAKDEENEWMRRREADRMEREQQVERIRRREADRMEREQQVERTRIEQREQIERSSQPMIQMLRRQLD